MPKLAQIHQLALLILRQQQRTTTVYSLTKDKSFTVLYAPQRAMRLI